MKERMNRVRNSRFLITVMGIIFVMCVVLLSMSIGFASAPRSPIKIGLLYPLVGPLSPHGKDQVRGWEIALEDRDYKVAGRPIELIVEDDKATPSVGLEKATKLIERDRVHILGGIVSSGVAYAIRDTVDRSRIPLVITMAAAGGLTQEKRSPFIFRVKETSGMHPYYMAQFLYNDLKLRKAVTTYADYAYGREVAEVFKKEFERLGGKVLFENFTPLGTSDYGPYCIKIADFVDKADVLFYTYAGADCVRFVKAAADFSLKKKFTIADVGGLEDGSLIAEAGAAAEGIYHISMYLFDLKNEGNQRYLKLLKKKGEAPSQMYFYGYLGAEVVLHALEQIKGNVEAKDEFLKALREVKFECPSGPYKFDPRSQNALVDMYIGQARKVDGEFGKYQLIRVKTIPQVQDPWWFGR